MNAHEMDIRRDAKTEQAIETARNLFASKAGSIEQIAAWVNLPVQQLQAELQPHSAK